MPSRRKSLQGPSADVAASDPPRFYGHDALTWPFPETQGSPVWQAWRAERDADRLELKAKGWAAVGLRQVMASRAHRQGRAVPLRDAEGSTGSSHSGAGAASDVVAAGEADRGRLGERLDLHFDSQLAQKLRRAALETLGDVAVADASGRRWWVLAPGIGPARAREIAKRVRALLEPGA